MTKFQVATFDNIHNTVHTTTESDLENGKRMHSSGLQHTWHRIISNRVITVWLTSTPCLRPQSQHWN